MTVIVGNYQRQFSSSSFRHQRPLQSFPQTQVQPQSRYDQHQQSIYPSHPRNLNLDINVDDFASDSPVSSATSSLFAYAASPEARRHQSPDDCISSTSGLSPPPELMQSGAWAHSAPLLTASKPFSRLSHHRDSSLSSLGSNGPASPLISNPSIAPNPHIVLDHVAADGLGDFSADDSQSPYHHVQAGLQTTSRDHVIYPSGCYGVYTGPVADMGHVNNALPGSGRYQMQQELHGGLLPPPDFSAAHGGRHERGSAAASIGSDSPRTPSAGNTPEDCDRRRPGTDTPPPPAHPHHSYKTCGNAVIGGGINGHNPPKLDRTISDICQDELYSPELSMTSPQPSQSHATHAGGNDVFSQRIHAANNQHIATPQSPSSISPCGQSPFRHGSPLAPSLRDFGSAAAETQERRATRLRASAADSTSDSLQTISPQEAMWDCPVSETGSNPPLFPSDQDAHNDEMSLDGPELATSPQFSLFPIDQDQFDEHFDSRILQDLLPSQLPSTGITVPQQYPFIARPRLDVHHSAGTGPPPTDKDDSEDDNSSSPSANMTQNDTTPGRTAADGGTYTCTYHGCTLRFETPGLLQKHKRDGHRSIMGTSGLRSRFDAMAGSKAAPGTFNTQAGPHRCNRINPSTNKPCGVIIRRPYDLTRHEDTIHNARKRKVRCQFCVEEKTFSRADALTRHLRVCHPGVDVPSRPRRKAKTDSDHGADESDHGASEPDEVS